MKNILAICLVLFGFLCVYAQDKNTDSTAFYNKIFFVSQRQPKFPGNVTSWIAEHTVYPKQAYDSNIQGTVYLNFIIEKDGSISNIKVLKGVQGGSSLDSESVKVASSMPNWTPGMQNGHPVRVQQTIPVNFKLMEDTDALEGYGNVQVKPLFPGNIKDWIGDHNGYPEIEISTTKQDTTYVSFIVERDGNISHVHVFGVTSRHLNRIALKLFSSMPKWTPGKKDGKTVRVLCTLPIQFDPYNANLLRFWDSVPQGFAGDKPIDTIYTAEHFRIIREQPKFPGDISSWLATHTNYPEKAKDANIQGTVFVTFIVEKDGSVSNVTILRGVNKYLDNEAIRVVSSLPKWTPGKQNGNPIRVGYNLPIRFVLRR